MKFAARPSRLRRTGTALVFAAATLAPAVVAVTVAAPRQRQHIAAIRVARPGDRISAATVVPVREIECRGSLPMAS